jgi:hypothetical protein
VCRCGPPAFFSIEPTAAAVITHEDKLKRVIPRESPQMNGMNCPCNCVNNKRCRLMRSKSLALVLPAGYLFLLLFVCAYLTSTAAGTVIPPRPITTNSKHATPIAPSGLAISFTTPSPHNQEQPRTSSSSVLNRAVTARPTPKAHVTNPVIAPHVAQNKTSIQLIAVAAQVQAQRLSASAVVKTIQRVNQQAPCPPTTREVRCLAFLLAFSLFSDT